MAEIRALVEKGLAEEVQTMTAYRAALPADRVSQIATADAILASIQTWHAMVTKTMDLAQQNTTTRSNELFAQKPCRWWTS